jgi:hypothetical protein
MIQTTLFSLIIKLTNESHVPNQSLVLACEVELKKIIIMPIYYIQYLSDYQILQRNYFKFQTHITICIKDQYKY